MARPGTLEADLVGFHQLIRNMDTLQRGPLKKATRAGIKAGLTPLRKAIVAGVNSAEASKRLKKSARKTVGTSLKIDKSSKNHIGSGFYEGKAGFGVGKQTKSQKQKAKGRSQSKTSGVGISKSNIHWFVLGTKERTGSGGRELRSIKPVFYDVVPKAVMVARSAMFSAAKKKIDEVLQREAKKMKT